MDIALGGPVERLKDFWFRIQIPVFLLALGALALARWTYAQEVLTEEGRKVLTELTSRLEAQRLESLPRMRALFESETIMKGLGSSQQVSVFLNLYSEREKKFHGYRDAYELNALGEYLAERLPADFSREEATIELLAQILRATPGLTARERARDALETLAKSRQMRSAVLEKINAAFLDGTDENFGQMQAAKALLNLGAGPSMRSQEGSRFLEVVQHLITDERQSAGSTSELMRLLVSNYPGDERLADLFLEMSKHGANASLGMMAWKSMIQMYLSGRANAALKASLLRNFEDAFSEVASEMTDEGSYLRNKIVEMASLWKEPSLLARMIQGLQSPSPQIRMTSAKSLLMAAAEGGQAWTALKEALKREEDSEVHSVLEDTALHCLAMAPQSSSQVQDLVRPSIILAMERGMLDGKPVALNLLLRLRVDTAERDYFKMIQRSLERNDKIATVQLGLIRAASTYLAFHWSKLSAESRNSLLDTLVSKFSSDREEVRTEAMRCLQALVESNFAGSRTREQLVAKLSPGPLADLVREETAPKKAQTYAYGESRTSALRAAAVVSSLLEGLFGGNHSRSSSYQRPRVEAGELVSLRREVGTLLGYLDYEVDARIN